MTPIVLECYAPATELPCTLCGRPDPVAAGTRLGLPGGAGPVCDDCGRRHAPALAALACLARSAEHVGRIGRAGVFPPLTALLDLARAAESYSLSAPGLRRAG